MHLSKEEKVIINTGSSNSRKEIINYLNELEDQRIKGILITSVNARNCGNLSYILNQYDVDQLYLPKHNTELCKVPKDFQKSNLLLK